jgi:predicted  nucleic acid-binding Zn-ribbon protein
MIENQTVEEKLKLLYELQTIDSSIDKIKVLRGELPLQVKDLEDEVAQLETRSQKISDELKVIEVYVAERKAEIKESEALIKKYEEQQGNVKNNREFDSLNKEIEYQNLEIQLSKKRIKEYNLKLSEKKEQASEIAVLIKERKSDLVLKRKELSEIIDDTQKEENELEEKSKKIAARIEPRLIYAYNRIRSNMKNGLSVVTVERDACGGCYNKIPPQRQLDIASRKKIIVCEYCGRVLVDSSINL